MEVKEDIMLSDAEEQALEDIEKYGKLFEVSKVTTYKGYREKDNKEVKIIIEDSGPKAGPNRYFVTASLVDEPEKVATGNGGDKISTALGILHWYDLD